MALHAYFYNSENGDRLYDADSFSDWLKKFFTTGVFEGDMQVTAGAGMQISVNPGYINIGGKVLDLQMAAELDVTVANASYDRIDSVVVERNDTERDFILKVVTGSATDSPTATPPVRETGIDQRVLAHIYVPAGATALTQADITDTRSDTDLCGIVAATVKEIDFSQIQAQYDSFIANYKQAVAADYESYHKKTDDTYNQYLADAENYENLQQELFSAWFNSVKDQLGADAAGNLQNQINDLRDSYSNATQSKTTVFNEDGSITETLADGRYKTTTFNEDGSITESYKAADGTASGSRTTVFNEDGSITESVATA